MDVEELIRCPKKIERKKRPKFRTPINAQKHPQKTKKTL